MTARNYNIDLLRVIACLMVVIIHASASNFYIDPASNNWLAANIFDALSRSAVPLFFMISGFLFLNREAIDLPRFLKKHVIFILTLFFLWSAIYAVFRGSSHFTNFVALIQSGPTIFMANTLKSTGHLWYLRALFVAYLLVPVAHAALHKGDIPIKYCLAVAAILILPGFLTSEIPFMPETIKNFIGSFEQRYLYYIGYMVLGYALGRIKLSKKSPALAMICFISIVAVAAFANWSYSISLGKAQTLLYENFDIPVVAEAILIFISINSLNIRNETSKKVILFISRISLGIYLIHPMIITLLKQAGVTTVSFNSYAAIPLVAVLAFVLSGLITFALKKIPGIRKWV